MVAPQNWEKTQDDRHLERWKHTETGQRLRLARIDRADYRIIYPNDDEEPYRRRKEAHRDAVEWMRNHVEGVPSG